MPLKKRIQAKDTPGSKQQPFRPTIGDLPTEQQVHSSVLLDRATSVPESLTHGDLLQLQRSVGNRSLLGILTRKTHGQGSTSTRSTHASRMIQRNPPDEIYDLAGKFKALDIAGEPFKMQIELVKMIYGDNVEKPERFINGEIKGIVELLSKNNGYEPFTMKQQKQYQGSLWNLYKSMFRDSRNDRDSPLKQVDFGLIKAFHSSRLNADGLGRMRTACELVVNMCSAEGTFKDIMAFTQSNMGPIKEYFINAYNKERGLEENKGTNAEIQSIQINDNVIRYLESAILKIINVIRSKNFEIFFDQSGPGAASGGTPDNGEAPSDIMDTKKQPNTIKGKYILSINLSATSLGKDDDEDDALVTNLIEPIDIATTIFHELMHIVGGNLGEEKGGGHYATLKDYTTKNEKIKKAKEGGDNSNNDVEEQEMSIPAPFADAYFMEAIWNLWLKHKQEK